MTIKKSSKEVLLTLTELLLCYLNELAEYREVEGELFEYGERTAYTECLEIIQEWVDAEKNGLDFNIEQKYPL
ncbi:MAG: hypothetical protein E7339_03155 [Clostridiales bacterium]|nr:hypothetical protein [Clostridiales bacterium]